MFFSAAAESGTDINQVKEEIAEMDTGRLEEYFDSFVNWLIDKVGLLIGALVFLFICSKLIKYIMKIVKKSFDKSSHMSESVSGFLLSLIRILLYTILFITTVSLLGFQVTSLVTILGSAGIAVGLALQGSLSNLAGGVLILILKPFVVGDYIIENDKGCEGTVVSIEIFYTKLKTADNKVIVIPNGNISATSVVNLTAQKKRRVEINVGVSYDADIRKAKDILKSIAEESQYTDKTEDINVFLDTFGESSINMGLRFWVPTESYWTAKWEASEQIKYKFDEAGIEIPYNQLEVSLKKENN